jgi:RNA polymerase sigma-70 factor (ECF subfamily)
VVFCITGSLDLAQDLAQESFVRLLRVRITHREGSLKSFLSTMAYRLALKERKRQASSRNLDAIDVADGSPSPLEEAIRDETDRIIVRIVQSLTVDHREILALRFFGGHSYEEIARMTSIPIGTVKSRIFYAVKMCREKLREQGVFT